MPRDSQGNYTLPAGINPVIPGTLIEAAWANTTLDDMAAAMTDSLPRSGAAPMVGPLTLQAAPPSAPRHATSKSYVDNFVAFSTGLPVGAIVAFAAASVPGGFLLCNGQAVSRTTYATLFALIGTSFGVGDGSTTFNVPTLTNQFIRGRDPATRAVGSTQSDAFKSHDHPLVDTGHIHGVTTAAHNHLQNAHNHNATQPAHNHTTYALVGTTGADGTGGALRGANGDQASTFATPAITVENQIATNQEALQSVTVNSATVLPGLTMTPVGDGETRPVNMAFDYYIKALQDSTGPVSVLSIQTSDAQMIAIDATLATSPKLDIKSNVPFGTVKLDGAAKIPLDQLPVSAQTYLGPFSAAAGNNPSQAFPTQTYISGDTYVISAAGSILVVNPITFVPAVSPVVVGQDIVYVSNGVNPIGWYQMAIAIATTASNVSVIPVGTISATNVQAALQELDTEKIPTTAINSTVMAYVAPGAIGNLLTSNGSAWTSASPGAGTGDVTGPAASTANAVAIFNGVSGKVIKDSAKLLPTGDIVGTSDTQALTGKTINLASNTLTGTLLEFNAALTGADFVSLAGSEVLTNKTINAANNTLTGTAAALSIGGNAATATSAGVATYSKQVPVVASAANLAATDAGKCMTLTAGITITSAIMAAGDAVSFYNDTAGPLTLTQGGAMVLRIPGAAAGANRVLAAYSQCTVWFRSDAIGVVTGAGVT